MKKPKKMITRKTWAEFRKAGFLWFINSILHVFGWAIVFNMADETDKAKGFKPGDIIEVFPARVKFRGFDHKVQEKAHRDLAAYMVKNAKALKAEADE